MSNRVEELESTVSELQAAVNGLTEELVETKERLRELEEQRGVEVDATVAPEDESSTADASGGSEIIESTPTRAETGEFEDSDGADDDGVKGEEAEEENNEEGSESSDIIVA